MTNGKVKKRPTGQMIFNKYPWSSRPIHDGHAAANCGKTSQQAVVPVIRKERRVISIYHLIGKVIH